MNVPIKVSKSKETLPNHTACLNQTITKNYIKVFKKGKQPKSNHSSGKDFSLEGKGLQEEVIKWLFSLDLPTRTKVCSIENKNLGNILHQLYQHSALDTRVKFLLKPNSSGEEAEDYSPMYYSSNNQPMINLSMSPHHFPKSNEQQSPNNYTTYFSTNPLVQTNIILNNYLKNNEINERDLLREIKFYNCEEENDTLTLSFNLMTDEEKFKTLFSYFSNNNYFTSLIDSEGDCNVKLLNLNLPTWVNVKDHYSFCQFLIAFFEQVILVWFYFYKFMGQNFFKQMLAHLNSDKKFSSLLEDIKKVVEYLRKRIRNNEDRRKMLSELNFKNISTSIRKDAKIAEVIANKKRSFEGVYQNCYACKYFHQPYERRSISDILEEAENFVRDKFYTWKEDAFIEMLLFHNFEKLYSYEDFFSKRVYEEIHNLYTKQNALELITDLKEEDGLKNQRKSSLNLNKKSKNAKKRKSKKQDEGELDLATISSTADNNKDNNADITKEEFKYSDEVLIEDIEDGDFILPFKKEIKEEKEVKFTKVLIKEDDSKEIKEYIHSLLETIFENTFTSIQNRQIKEVKAPETKINKKKEKNSFFLYTTNPAHYRNRSKKSTKFIQEEKETIPQKQEVMLKSETANYIEPIQTNEENHQMKENTINNPNNLSPNYLSEIEGQEIKPHLIISKEESVKIDSQSTKDDSVPSKFNQKVENNAEKVESNNIQITINSPVYNNYYIINPPNNLSYDPLIHPYINSRNNRSFVLKPDPFNEFLPYNFPSPMMYMQPSPTFDLFNRPVPYHILHNDILVYSREVNDNIMSLKRLKFCLIQKLEELIKESLADYDINLTLYGSFATDLEIESSDIDITVRYQMNSDKISSQSQSYISYNYQIEKIIKQLVNSFNEKKVFEKVNPILTATVPVIKLQIDLMTILDEKEKIMFKQFKESPNYLNYKFDKNEIDKVRVDLTFLDSHKNSYNTFESPSQQAVEFVKNYLLCFPEIRPLIHVLKRLLHLEKLNSSFNGGMASFSLFLILFAFLKYKKYNSSYGFNNHNLGNLLLEFLEFYANFNFSCNFIDVNSSNPFILSNEVLEQIPLILDPITYLNVGKSTYRIEEIKQTFLKTSHSLYNTMFSSQSLFHQDRQSSNVLYTIFSQIKSQINV